MAQEITSPKPLKSGYAPVNGLKLYYEIHGQGQPLLLLHGSFMTISLNWGQIIPELAKTRQVIAVEMQGHGHTADIDRPISYQAMAEDAAALLGYLKIDSTEVLGYSLGATIGLQMAAEHPKLVKKLIFISSAYKTEGWTKATRDQIAMLKPEFLVNTPLKTEYDKFAPDPKHWNAFISKMLVFENQHFDVGIEKIRKLKFPILMINGDNDGVEFEHSAELYRAFGGGVMADIVAPPRSQYAILPGKSHVTLMMDTPALTSIILPFLK
ncbi:oxidoreductase [Dyadobacter endophyticus]|uniref:Oxidoreductase n=2 Tax=Dyadobacter endophyticus TaxID=1749036 RepID=A0ABQ1YL30_9BACT|nr:oxidoreductase [Dyadobacter endophyticus]